MTAKIVQLTPPTPEAFIRAKIQRETAVFESKRGLYAPMSARETLINYAEVLQDNAVYLSELSDVRLDPVIDSIVDMTARIRYWLIE
ncbi:MAG: hypothetical protein AB2697_21865 [Candidatus Thiodiazotropha endolucinida]